MCREQRRVGRRWHGWQGQQREMAAAMLDLAGGGARRQLRAEAAVDLAGRGARRQVRAKVVVDPSGGLRAARDTGSGWSLFFVFAN